MLIIQYICLFLLVSIHGIREGFTWANKEERLNNIFITSKLGSGRAKIDYHGWRSIEYFLIWGLTGFALWALAIGMMAQVPYNGILHKICNGKFFYEREHDFSWMSITIPKWVLSWRTDWLLFFIGLTIFLGIL